MADNTTLSAGTGGDTLRTEDRTTFKTPVSLIDVGGSAGESLIGDAGVSMPINDASGSLTVDAPVGTPVFVRLSDGSAAISTLPVSLASVPSHAVTNAGTFAVQASQSGTWAVTDGGGSLTIDGSVAITGSVTVASHDVTNAGTFAVQVSSSALPSGAATAANQTTANSSLSSIDTKITACNTGAVVVSSALPAGTNAIGKLAANSGVTIGAVEIASAQTLATVTTVTTCSTVTTLTGSGVAHDAADSGNPHKIGAKATTALSGLTLVADADRTDLRAGVDGVLINRPHCNLEDIVSGVAAITDGSSTSVISAAGAGVKVYITEVIIANSSSTNVTVDIRDGAAGTVKGTFSAPANGGSHKTLSTPIPFSANTAVCADPSAAASTVTVTLIGFKSKV